MRSIAPSSPPDPDGRPRPTTRSLSMLLQIRHETKLSYSAPVSETVFEVRMAPPTDEDQTSLRYSLRITPQAPVTSYRAGFGNRVDLFNVATPYRELIVEATSYIRTHRRPCRARLE